MTAKIPRDDPRAAYMAHDARVDLEGLVDFVGDRHQWILATTRADGRPQLSPVTGGLTSGGQLAIATYPGRAKTNNARRDPSVSVLVLGAAFSEPWLQVDGVAEVFDMPDAVDGLVEYYRCISGEHPDWPEYRQAMVDQGKSVILIDPTRWGPISKGGFPPQLFED